jgi:dihydrofolate synthase/folylpolyglutamate synthase
VIEPSFFEWSVGLALDYFAHEEVDVAIIEVGLGGRLDSTNIITPEACLITNISFDHMNLLGDTLEKISTEKAGIIKPRVPVVVSQYQSESASIFSARARELRAPIEFGDKNYRILSTKKTGDKMEVRLLNKKTAAEESYLLDLTGTYQLKNLLGVLNLLGFIEKSGFMIEPENVYKALQQVVKLTGLQGRWQTLGEKPLMIADSGHNEDGIKQVLNNLETLTYDELHFVFGAVNDKDITKILGLLPKTAKYYFVRAAIPRALDEQELKKSAAAFKLNGSAYASVAEGLQAAKKAAAKSDLILIGGSTFVVADALAL